MEPVGSLSRSKQPTTCPYSELGKSSPTFITLPEDRF